ncbi:MAG: DUF1801 domain-containing protein [Bacteroidia bacterium]
MAELKTQKTRESVTEFLNGIEDEGKRKACKKIVSIMKEATGKPAAMWGPAIVGFGDYSYKYESGHGSDWFQIGFSPRKANIAIYLMGGYDKAVLPKLGKVKTAKSCFYLNDLESIDVKVFEKMVKDSIVRLKAKTAGQ